LEPEAHFTGADEHRQAPAAIGLLHHDDAIAVLDAKEETRLELVDDDEGAGALQHGGGDGGVGPALKFLEDGLARLDAVDEIGAGGFGAHKGGAEEREEGKDEEFLHDGAKRLNGAQCMHGAANLESAE